MHPHRVDNENSLKIQGTFRNAEIKIQTKIQAKFSNSGKIQIKIQIKFKRNSATFKIQHQNSMKIQLLLEFKAKVRL